METFQGDLLSASREWDDYWNKKNRGGWLYGIVAEFYRKFIIRPTLNRVLRKNFPSGAQLIHAGCGSGQVDADIAADFKITGVDISPRALELYQESNPRGSVLLSSIFQIRLPDASVDGVYNLGVMEHLTDEEIQTSLIEFHRILKVGGKVVLFWPPEYGLSVLFFKALRGIIKLVSGKDVKFHPDEISRVQSRGWVTERVQQAGYAVTSYEFGPRDVFTYSIIVGQKTF